LQTKAKTPALKTRISLSLGTKIESRIYGPPTRRSVTLKQVWTVANEKVEEW